MADARTQIGTPDPDGSRRSSPVRDDLCRSAPFELTRTLDEGSDGLTIEGYGAVFNSVTRISGWEGDFEETIAPGAFKKSLRERVPRMQFDHGQHPLLGSLPLGLWAVAEEDERGLHLVGRLTDNWLVLPFRDAIRDGGVEGMSFRFAVVRDEWTDAQGTRLRDHEIADHLYGGGSDRGPIRRTLREVKASEAGPVVWPAYEDTAVGVRSALVARPRGTVVIDLARLQDPDQRKQLAEVVALADAGAGIHAGVAARLQLSLQESATGGLADATYSNYARHRREATEKTLLDAGYAPAAVVEFVSKHNGLGSLAELEHINEKYRVQLRPTEPEPVAAQPPENVPVGSPNVEQQVEQIEPQPTAPPADNHPAPQAAPEVTERAAGEHSAPASRPANPVERRDLIRAEYRDRLKHLLAITQSSPHKKESA